MIINHNLTSANAWRMNKMNTLDSQKSTQKLASGLRINGAGDDTAGLAISEKMRGQIRGLNQAQRNIQDSISLIQTTEGGLQEVHSLLQRGRELSVQAINDTLTTADREEIQKEIGQIVKEVDRVSSTTNFNGIKLLNSSTSQASSEQEAVITALKKSWLLESEKLITTNYGLTADGASLEIQLIQNSGDDSVA